MEDNSHAGQGSVLLDIGGDIGALVVTMPADLEGQEIEIRPVGQGRSGHRGSGQPHTHDHDHDHAHDQTHDHPHDQTHDHPHDQLVHVGVVGRPADGQLIHSAVFGELTEGRYELYIRPDGPVQLTAEVIGGQVSQADWPT